MRVWTSDGRWNRTKLPKDVIGIVNQLGGDGWELAHGSSSTAFSTYTPNSNDYAAVFKRPIA
jgi:hypothetical protein